MVRKVLNIIGTVILVFLIIIVVVVFYARLTHNVPELFGFQLFRVSSGSMSPELEVGDVILSRRVSAQDIHEGDIVTYLGEVGELKDKLITHKVIKEPYQNSDGVYMLETQGTAMGTVPDPAIRVDQVIGKYLSRMTFLNGVYSFFITPVGLIVFIGVIILLFAYEMISLIVSYKSLDDADNLPEKNNSKNHKKKKADKNKQKNNP